MVWVPFLRKSLEDVLHTKAVAKREKGKPWHPGKEQAFTQKEMKGNPRPTERKTPASWPGS